MLDCTCSKLLSLCWIPKSGSLASRPDECNDDGFPKSFIKNRFAYSKTRGSTGVDEA